MLSWPGCKFCGKAQNPSEPLEELVGSQAILAPFGYVQVALMEALTELEMASMTPEWKPQTELPRQLIPRAKVWVRRREVARAMGR